VQKSSRILVSIGLVIKGLIMKTSEEIARFQGKPFSATCINIMAKFVQVARHEEGEDIHLQDKNILEHISEIGHTTDNQHLILLHKRLFEELDHAFPIKQQQVGQSTISNTLKSWGFSFK